MSKPSKVVKSGLGTVKRDWLDSSIAQPKPSQEIYWPPTPTTNQPPAAPTQKLTGSEQRMKDIQDALAGYTNKVLPLTASTTLNKRSSPDAGHTAAPAAKKARKLPWDIDPLSEPSFGKSSLVSSSRSSNTTRTAAVSKSTHVTSSSSATTPSTTSSSKSKMASVFLSQEQVHILNLVKEGESIFYTGSAGTGKSVLLREIIKTLKKKHFKIQDAVAITASTGIAACNIGGVTIHSFSGIGLGIETAEELATKIRKNKKALTRWLRTKVLIIDEVSMVDGDLFDKLARIGSILRKTIEPFGGIQISSSFHLLRKGSAQVKFAFEAAFWMQSIKRTFNLTKVFRQRDQQFVDMLNEMRFGTLSPASIRKFRELTREIQYDDGLGPTELFPRREDVERSNSTRMVRLQTKQKRYGAQDGGTIQDENQRQKMLNNFMAPQVLTLRVDAQVMLIKNVDETLVNGSMGRVVRFADPASYGSELDKEGIPGEASMVGGGSSASGGVGTATKGKAKQGPGVETAMFYPVVEFMIPSGGKRTMLVLPETWKVELPSGEVQLSRTQLPLILSWAMSIHKSQGQTLDRVKVDLGKVFEKGQAYVALSRATSLEGLQVLNFDPSKVNAHPKVVQWTKTLQTVSES